MKKIAFIIIIISAFCKSAIGQEITFDKFMLERISPHDSAGFYIVNGSVDESLVDDNTYIYCILLDKWGNIYVQKPAASVSVKTFNGEKKFRQYNTVIVPYNQLDILEIGSIAVNDERSIRRLNRLDGAGIPLQTFKKTFDQVTFLPGYYEIH